MITSHENSDACLNRFFRLTFISTTAHFSARWECYANGKHLLGTKTTIDSQSWTWITEHECDLYEKKQEKQYGLLCVPEVAFSRAHAALLKTLLPKEMQLLSTGRRCCFANFFVSHLPSPINVVDTGRIFYQSPLRVCCCRPTWSVGGKA